MKTSTALLAGSLALNAVLAAFLLFGDTRGRGETTLSPTGDDRIAHRSASGAPLHETAPASKPAWHRLNANDDLPTLVARLRAAGFPAPVLRAIITALVAERFDAERYKIDAAALNTPYWQMWPNSYLDPKVGPELRRLQREQQTLVQQLLGETGAERSASTEEGMAMLQQQMGDIPREKWDRVNAYLSSFNEKRIQIYSANGQRGPLLPADLEKLAALDKSMRDGLNEFLSPHEAGELILRSSSAAGQLSWTLGPFRPTEEEYRAIFPHYQALMDQFPGTAPLGQPSRGAVDPARKMAQDSMLAQLASTLGSTRADELKIALDPQYAGLNRLVSRLDLPLSAAKQVYEVQQEIQRRAAATQNNAALAADARTQQLAALAQEASKKISEALGGPAGLEAYQQNGGQWLTSLTPPKG